MPCCKKQPVLSFACRTFCNCCDLVNTPCDIQNMAQCQVTEASPYPALPLGLSSSKGSTPLPNMSGSGCLLLSPASLPDVPATEVPRPAWLPLSPPLPYLTRPSMLIGSQCSHRHHRLSMLSQTLHLCSSVLHSSAIDCEAWQGTPMTSAAHVDEAPYCSVSPVLFRPLCFSLTISLR